MKNLIGLRPLVEPAVVTIIVLVALGVAALYWQSTRDLGEVGDRCEAKKGVKVKTDKGWVCAKIEVLR